MKTALEYADELIEKYGLNVFNNFDYIIAVNNSIKCAIIDVENTINALNEQYIEIWGKSKDWKYTEHNTYYNNVLQILKDKL